MHQEKNERFANATEKFLNVKIQNIEIQNIKIQKSAWQGFEPRPSKKVSSKKRDRVFKNAPKRSKPLQKSWSGLERLGAFFKFPFF